MEKDKLISKKKFLGIIGLGAFTSLIGWNLFRKINAKNSDKVKMLTADGKLVEESCSFRKTGNTLA